jgi:CRISPR-associated exonuclease Cas4
VLYTDTGAWQRPEAPLFSARYRLTGKPDYLVKVSGHVIPVEVKSGPCPSRPYPSHRLQLASYCLLVQEVHGQAPPYGLLKYADRTVRVDYTADLRRDLLAVLRSMRRDAIAAEVPRRHHHAARCQACGFRSECGEALA